MLFLIITRFYIYFFRVLLKMPFISGTFCFRKLHVNMGNNVRVSKYVDLLGDYSLLTCADNSEINPGCFLLAKDRIVLGENSTLAYKVVILTSANPNYPYNELSKIYPKMTKPVIIENDVWVGACAIILHGVRIGEHSVVAAGSVVTKDVPSHTMVAGCPARVMKHI